MDIARARRHSVGDLLHRTARRYPQRLAVVDGEQRFSFAQLDQAVNRTAHALAERGLGKGDRLALVSHNCWQFAVLAFAAAKAGIVLVPVNFMLNAAEIAFILEHSEARGVVCEDSLADTVGQALVDSGIPDPVRGWIPLSGAPTPPRWEDVATWCSSGPDDEPDVVVGDDDPLRLMYTSGTESRPKGVVLTSRSLIAQYVGCAIDGGMDPQDVELHSLPMYHCAQLDCFFSVDVYLGATSIIAKAPEPGRMLDLIERERVTKLFCPPTVWISLLTHPDFETSDLSSLRKGYYGASAMPVEVLKELQRRLPHVQLWNFYGQTEMAPLATILRPDEQVERAGSAGKASVNVETMVVGEDGKELPAGDVGEIVHRSPHACLGYYRDQEKTAHSFRGGWFHTGDLGYMTADGYLYVVDRIKDMIKTGGENVASREVEEVLFEMDGVAEVAVFGIPDPRWVEAVTAAVVPKPGAIVDPEAVKAHARSRLAGFKTPKYVVALSSLPKNPSGKILKRELRDRFADLAMEDPPGS